jgi:Ser-tRNA(Ala) deacylase AlaX
MTRRDYYFSDVVEADSHIVSCEESEGRWSVQLEGTVFHPQGGGQLADAGWIDDCPVLAVEAHGEAVTTWRSAHWTSAPSACGWTCTSVPYTPGSTPPDT